MHKARKSFAFSAPLVTLLGGTVACHEVQNASQPALIGAEDLMRRIQAGEAPLVLDVRTEEEFALGHIPTAMNIPHSDLSNRLGELHIARSDEVVVYCRSGHRASMAEEILRAAGYTNVHDLAGHMTGWLANGHRFAK